MSERIRIPVTALLRHRQDIGNLVEGQRQDVPDTQAIFTIDKEFWTTLVTGSSSLEVSIFARFYEQNFGLLSKSFVEFPSTEQNFTDETITKARELGLEQMEVPGFTGVPILTDLLQKGEMDLKWFYQFWQIIAPKIPPPLLASLGRHSTDYSSPFLSGILRSQKGPYLVEEDGYTEYVSRFASPRCILMEIFPDPENEESQPPSSALLEKLGIGRTFVSRLTLHNTLEEKGPGIIEELGLDPEKYALRPIRYEDFLRIGNDLDWGRGPFATHMEGWMRHEGDLLLPIVAGMTGNRNGKRNTGYHEGLSDFFIPNELWRDRILHEGSEWYMTRLAVSPRIDNLN